MGPFGVRSGSVQDLFGIHSGSVRNPFGAISDQNFRRRKLKNSKILKKVRPSPPRQGPSSRRPEPTARRAPAAAATAAQIENCCKKSFRGEPRNQIALDGYKIDTAVWIWLIT